MVDHRPPALFAQSTLPAGPAAASSEAPRPAAPSGPAYPSIVRRWLNNIDDGPWSKSADGYPVTVDRILDQLAQFHAVVHKDSGPFHSAPACVKRYRIDLLAWESIYDVNQPECGFAGDDPEPECLQLGMWSVPPALAEDRRNQRFAQWEREQLHQQQEQLRRDQRVKTEPPQAPRMQQQLQRPADSYIPAGPGPMSATRREILEAKGADYVPMWGWVQPEDVPMFVLFSSAVRSYNALVGHDRVYISAIQEMYPGVKIMYQKLNLNGGVLALWMECFSVEAAHRLNRDPQFWDIFRQCFRFLWSWTRLTGAAVNVVQYHAQYRDAAARPTGVPQIVRPGIPVGPATFGSNTVSSDSRGGHRDRHPGDKMAVAIAMPAGFIAGLTTGEVNCTNGQVMEDGATRLL
ncbi:hypothetical protein VTL71DRAFT_5981 [Oculimacula yallundae]|uniref:Uncharacterized protein n=1 Tax=Oculimacula yallundae TaxID=86028 RepID=A0ABR4BZ16_9HELO